MSLRKRYASSTDVARLAGVSQSAVSRSFKPGGSVSAEMRRKIAAAAEALDYKPSLIPRIMLTERSGLVAVIIGRLDNPFYATILEKFTSGLEALGYQPVVVAADSGYKLDDAIQRLASYRVDAILSPLAILSAEAHRSLARLMIPVVSLNTRIGSNCESTISCDNHAAGRAIVDVFAEAGCRRLGFVCGPADSPAADERRAGFLERAKELRLRAPRIASGDFRYEGGLTAARELLRGTVTPDAIFCANDLLALGVIDAAREEFGLRVPEALKVAGFDDIPAASWKAYELTTFVQDAETITTHALAVLGRAMASPAPHSERIVLPVRLLKRRSA